MLKNLRVSELANGIRVVTLSKPDAEGVRLAIHVRVGSRNESEALNGVSHFIEHMLFKGTVRRSAKAISQSIEAQGGSINAYTDRDNTCYYALVPREKLTLALDVLGDLFYHSVFDPKEFERERRVIAEEIRMYDDQPDCVAIDRLVSQLWQKHPLGKPIAGTLRSVAGLSRSDVLAYLKAQYTPERTLFAFSGSVDHDACVEAVKALAGRLRRGRGVREPKPFNGRVAVQPIGIVRRAIQQTQLAFGWRTPGVAQREEMPPLAMLSCLLGETMMSRLFQNIRERRGLCYSVSSGLSLGLDTGALVVTAGCDSARAMQCATAIREEMRRLCDRPASSAEVRRTCDYLCGRFRLKLDEAPIGWVAGRVLFGLPVDPEAVLEAYRAVTPQEIQSLAQRLVEGGQCAMTVVAPEGATPSDGAWEALASKPI